MQVLPQKALHNKIILHQLIAFQDLCVVCHRSKTHAFPYVRLDSDREFHALTILRLPELAIPALGFIVENPAEVMITEP